MELLNKEQILKIVQENNFTVTAENRLANDTGWQIKLSNGAIINSFDKGSWNVQGKCATEVKQLLGGQIASNNGKSTNNNVFVVYGHNASCRTALEALLRRWGLNPLMLDQLPSEGQTVIEKLESTTDKCGFGIILATPDDEGFRAGHVDEKQFRARQNIVLELGMLLAKLGRKRIAILLKDQTDMEKQSDISGLMYIPFKDSIDDAKIMLFKELNDAGYYISPEKL